MFILFNKSVTQNWLFVVLCDIYSVFYFIFRYLFWPYMPGSHVGLNLCFCQAAAILFDYFLNIKCPTNSPKKAAKINRLVVNY